MYLQHVNLDAVLRRLAERHIEEAMKEGKFSNLPGEGRPLDLEPMPADETVRMTWWMLRILRHNNILPEEVRWRKRVDQLKEAMASIQDDERLRKAVHGINHLIRRINTLGTNALKAPMAPVDLEEERRRRGLPPES
jgi:hypothetical protein